MRNQGQERRSWFHKTRSLRSRIHIGDRAFVGDAGRETGTVVRTIGPMRLGQPSRRPLLAEQKESKPGDGHASQKGSDLRRNRPGFLSRFHRDCLYRIAEAGTHASRLRETDMCTMPDSLSQSVD